MYQKALTFSLIFIAAVAEVSLFPNFSIGRVAPDLILILVIIWSSRKSFESFWIWAIISGFTLDILTLGRLGINAISFLIISFAINSLSKRFFVGQKRRAFLGVAFLVFFGTSINYLIGTGLHEITQEFIFETFSYKTLTLKIINNLLALVIIYWPVASSRKIFPAEEPRLLVR